MAAVEPKPSETCAHCGNPRRAAGRRHEKATTGTKIPAALWLTSIERDPFCSMECCRAFYGFRVEPLGAAIVTCKGCGKQLRTKYRPEDAGDECYNCARKAKFSGPNICVGCGGDRAEFTPGCRQCYDRKRDRVRRADPEYRAKENARLRRQRRKAKFAPGHSPVEAAPPLAVSGADMGVSPARGVTLQQEAA